MAAFDLPPRKLRVKADAHVGADHVDYGGGVVAFKNNVRAKARVPAELVAYQAKLAGAGKADKPLVHYLVKRNGMPPLIFPLVGHGKKNLLGAGIDSPARLLFRRRGGEPRGNLYIADFA